MSSVALAPTLEVTLTAVSDWLRLSVWPTHCLGSMARRCFSEVMSFWDLESSRRQRVTVENNKLCQDQRGSLFGVPHHLQILGP